MAQFTIRHDQIHIHTYSLLSLSAFFYVVKFDVEIQGFRENLVNFFYSRVCELTLKVSGNSLPTTSFSRTVSFCGDDMTHLNWLYDFGSLVLLQTCRSPFAIRFKKGVLFLLYYNTCIHFLLGVLLFFKQIAFNFEP